MKTITDMIIGFLLGILFLAFIWWVSVKHQAVKEQPRYIIDRFQVIRKDTNDNQFVYTAKNKADWIIYFCDSNSYVVGYDEVYLIRK